jgi:hypothetical protein
VSERWARISLCSLGILAVVLAIAGLVDTAYSVYRVASGAVEETLEEFEVPYFYPVFYVMASICVAFYVVLMFCGLRFIRLRSDLWWLFAAGLVSEMVAFHSIGYWLWPHPTLGRSVAAATGISTVGLTYQFLLLFPLWAPILAYIAHRKLEPPRPLPTSELL